MVTEDDIGLINLVDEDGQSPLQLACRNKQNTSLLLCMKVITIKDRTIRAGRTSSVNVDYQDGEGFTAFHRVLMNLEEAQLHQLKNQMIERSIELEKVATDGTVERNKNYFLSLIPQHRFETHFVDVVHTTSFGKTKQDDQKHQIYLTRMLIENGMDVTTKRTDGTTILNYLGLCYTHDNLKEVAQL